MKWSNVNLILRREIRDQSRDRRTLFTIAILPLLLYPLLGMTFLQISQFLREHPTKIWIIGSAELPDGPQLIEEDSSEEKVYFSNDFFSELSEARLLELTVDKHWFPSEGDKSLKQTARDAVESGEYDAVVHFPDEFTGKLLEYRDKNKNGKNNSPDSLQIPAPVIYFDTAKDKSRIANVRVENVLKRWQKEIVDQKLETYKVPASTTQPFTIVSNDVAEVKKRRAAVWSKILPFVLFVWALTGAFYPAVDLCAGEKERGTLETLLSSPARRSEIVWGKLLAIMLFSVSTSILNLLSMGLTGTFLMKSLGDTGSGTPGLAIGAPPLESMGWLLLALIPISALFSALALAVATLARSSKEGQYYLMPLLMISMPLMMLPLFPTAQLDWGTSLIPITGVMLLLRSLMEGQYLEAIWFTLPVVGVTAVCCLLAIRWAIDQFNNESVLFRESEQLSLGLWLRHLVRDRGDTPSFGEAIMCGLLLLMIRFFAMFIVPAPNSWNSFAVSTMVTQIALFASPALLMAVMLTRKPRKTLLIQFPSWTVFPVTILLALVFHPITVMLSTAIQSLYPWGEETEMQLEYVTQIIGQAPTIWHLILVMALTPAICEELAFRGFILSGLRHMGHKWGAIVLSSIFFGVVHGVLQQSINACIVGMVLGYMAVQTGSLLPCILFHLIHNSLAVAADKIITFATENPQFNWLIRTVDGESLYSWPLTILCLLIAAVILLWFRRLPYQASAEEKLQDALDHQSAQATAL